MSVHQSSNLSGHVPKVDAAWHVSTYSTNGAGQCVEAGLTTSGIPVSYAIRDSRHRTHGALVLNAREWALFLGHLKSSELSR